MDTISIRCSQCGYINVLTSFSGEKCLNCGFPIVPSNKKPLKLSSDLFFHAVVVAVAILIMKLAYHFIQRFIYGTGGEDLAGLIAIIGIVGIVIYVIIVRRRNS